MTFCAGWKYHGYIFLISDTLITKSEKPSSEYSSFGQLYSETRTGFVEEALVKLVPIGEGIAVAFSGDVQIASEIIELLSDNANYVKSATDLVHFINSMGPFDARRGVELLIAYSTANGDSELIKWDTFNGVDKSDASYYQIGSLKSYHAGLPLFLINEVDRVNLDVDKILPTISSIIQSYAMQVDLIQMNIGGLVFGLSTFNGKVMWQKDTNYVLYSQNSANPISFISAFVRDNILVVNSSITDDIRMFSHSASVGLIDVKNQDWIDKIRNQLDSDRYHYWAFISIKERNIILLTRTDLDKKSNIVKFSILENGKYDLRINQWLVSLLQQPTTNRDNDKLGFRVIQCVE